MIYEETYGPIPEGHYVVFLDGNRENFDPKNLMAVPGGAKSYFNRKFGYTGNAEANKANWLLATLEYKAKKCLAPLICERFAGRDETIWIQKTDDLTKIWFMDRWKKV